MENKVKGKKMSEVIIGAVGIIVTLISIIVTIASIKGTKDKK